MRQLILLILVTIFFIGCARRTTGPIVSNDTLEKRLADIHSLIEEGTCNTGSQCQYIAYGKKACGGPSGYLIFSGNIDIDKLKKLVNEYTLAEDIYNKENQIKCDCSIPNPPQKMECQGGNCIEVK